MVHLDITNCFSVGFCIASGWRSAVALDIASLHMMR